MSKQIYELHKQGVGTELTNYMKNLEVINQVKSCIEATRYESNVYKVVASFEDAGITVAQEVPVGSIKEKMNWLLSQAISKIAPHVHENMQLAGVAAKQWNAQVVTENQQERLNAATSKLKTPVKNESIPSYSDMSDGQRSRVQAIFQEILKKDEPLPIDFITDALDRYNAGADKTVLFRTLGLTLEYSNSLAVYEQDTYNTLMHEQMFSYLLMRWESYQRMVKAIGNAKNLDAKSLSVIVDTAGYAKVPQIDNEIKDALKKIDFHKAINEYKENSKESTNYEDVKPYLNGVNTIMPLSINNRNRLRGLCTIVESLQSVPTYQIDDSKTDMTSEEIYHSLAVYFEVMEEITQNLMVFMFLTQTTVRNNTLVEDVITAITMVDVTLDSLFNKIHDASGEDGNVSQEGFKDIINKITGSDKLPVVKAVNHVNMYNAVVNLANDHNSVSDVLFRLKLRDTNSLDETKVAAFKTKHKEQIKNIFDTDISKMGTEDLFAFMTSDIFGKSISHNVVKPLTCDLYDTKSTAAKGIMSFIKNDEAVYRLLHEPFLVGKVNFFNGAASAMEEFSKLMHAVDPELEGLAVRDIVSTTLESFADNWDGSYYNDITSFEEVIPAVDMTLVPGLTFTSPVTNVKTELGYRNIDITTQHKLFNYFTPNKKTTLSLNGIKNNMNIFTLCKHEFEYMQHAVALRSFLGNSTNGLTTVKSMYDVCDSGKKMITKTINDCSELDNSETKQYTIAVDAMLKDMAGAITDIGVRDNFIDVILTTSHQTSTCLRDLYINFSEIAEDFIGLAR